MPWLSAYTVLCPHSAGADGYAKRAAEGYRPERAECISEDVWRLICACWAQDPLERLPMRQVVARLQTLLSRCAPTMKDQSCPASPTQHAVRVRVCAC